MPYFPTADGTGVCCSGCLDRKAYVNGCMLVGVIRVQKGGDGGAKEG